MIASKATELLNSLGDQLGIDHLSWDEGKNCHLLIEDGTTLLIRHAEVSDQLILASVIADEVPEPMGQDLIKDLLSHALSPMKRSGPAVGLDEESGFLVAYWLLPINALTTASILKSVSTFIDYQAFMKARLSLSPELTRIAMESDEGLSGNFV